MHIFNKKALLFSLLIVIALILRIYKIESVPVSLYYDEVDYGYQARSLISDLKDYRGSFSPFYVHSFNDIRTPIPAYFTAITTLLFKIPEWQVRGPSFVLGTLIIVLIFAITLSWTKNYWAAFLVGLVFATNPWQMHYSRFSHEVIPMMFLYLAGLLAFFKGVEQKKFPLIFLSTILFSLTVYTYRTMSLYIPLTFIIIFCLFYNDLIRYGFKKLILLTLAAALIIIPFLYFTTFGAPDLPRINQLSLTSDPQIPIWVQRNRELDSGDFTNRDIGKQAVFSSYIIHNKPISWLDAFFNNYFSAFSFQFLFIEGDHNLRHSISDWGHFYFIDLIGLLSGLLFVWQKKANRVFLWLLIWLITSPILSAITFDGSTHASRLFMMSAPILIIIGLGWYSLFSYLSKTYFRRAVLIIILIVWVLQFSFYLHEYFIHYPIDSARFWGYGFKEAMLKITAEESKYDHVVLAPGNEPPMIYYLFWSKTPAKFLHEYGTEFSPEIFKNKKLDKYKVMDFTPNEQDLSASYRTDTIYLVTLRQLPVDLRDINNLPKGIKLIDIIKYPDNEVAFYIVTKDQNYASVLPD